jgi:hypothetical protein
MGAVVNESTNDPADAALEAFRFEFQRYKRQAERVFEQLADEDFFRRLNDDQNSIYVIVKHMAGNMRSRFTAFLTSDGEKPDRDRDSEFLEEVVPRARILATWERGWACVFDALASLTGEDLSRTVTVRREAMTAASAIARQVAHYGYHVGQITLLGKHFVGKDWKYITVPRGGSKDFNRSMGMESGNTPA